MTRKKIKIEKLDTKRKIMVTYAKRRETVFKKADQLCALHLPDDGQTRVAVITFSVNGRPFVFGSPDVDSVVDAFLHQSDVDDELLSSLPAAVASGVCDAALSTTTASAGSSKGKRKKEEEEEWLSLEGCDTLEALEAKRDEFVKVKAMIDELKLIRARTGELPSTSAPPTPQPLRIVSTTATTADDEEEEEQEQRYVSDLVMAAGGAESSDKFVFGDDDVYVSLDAFFPEPTI